MKKAITSLFVVCILMALPLTSVAESLDVVDDIHVSKTIINTLSQARSTIKERIDAYHLLETQGMRLCCWALYLSIVFLTILNFIITGKWIPLPPLPI